tara:strand:- start:56 stop:994 length:939 start_codon:yes stop_codon:yes gene_type:complete
MILKYLKNSHSYLIVLFIIFGLLFFSASIFTEEFKNIDNIFPFYSYILLFFCFVITLLHSIGLNNLIYEKDVIKKPNFVIGVVFLLLNTTFIINYKMILFSFGMLWFLYYLLSLYKQKRPFSLVFNAGIILSILSIYIPSVLVFVTVILFSCLVFRNISWRIIVLSVLSLFIPYIFLWVYQIAINETLYIPELCLASPSYSFNFLNMYLHQKIWWCLIAVVSVLSFFELFRWMYKKSIRSRESFIVIIFYFIIGVLAFLFSQNKETLVFIFIPLSVVIGNFFVYYKKARVGGFIFFLFLFSSIFYRVSMINM